MQSWQFVDEGPDAIQGQTIRDEFSFEFETGVSAELAVEIEPEHLLALCAIPDARA